MYVQYLLYVYKFNLAKCSYHESIWNGQYVPYVYAMCTIYNHFLKFYITCNL